MGSVLSQRRDGPAGAVADQIHALSPGIVPNHRGKGGDHATAKQATDKDPVVLTDASRPVSVTLMRTGDPIDHAFEDGTLSFAVPEDLKAREVTDVGVVDFGAGFDTSPYGFRHG